MRKVLQISVMVILAIGVIQGVAFGRVVTIDFETLPDGTIPTDDSIIFEQYKLTHLTTFEVDLDGDINTDSSDDRKRARFEQRGPDTDVYSTGFRYDQGLAFDQEAPGFVGQLGEYFLRLISVGANPTQANLLIEFTESVNEVSGNIWDIDTIGDHPEWFEQWDVHAYTKLANGTYVLLDTIVSPKGIDPLGTNASNSLDGKPWLWQFTRADFEIDAVMINFSGARPRNVGLAFELLRIMFEDPEPETDLTIEKIDNVDPVMAGNSLTYTVDVSNLGPSDAQNVVVTDTLPGEVTYVSDTAGCVEGPVGTLTCSLGDLAANASISFDITVTVKSDTPAGEITNTAEVKSDTLDPNPGNNSANEPTTVIEPGPGPGPGGPGPGPTPTPEPGTILLLGIGLVGILALRRRQGK